MIFKKYLAMFVIMLMGITPVLSASSVITIDHVEQEQEQKKWTLMLYDNADSLTINGPPTPSVLYNFSQHAFSNENLNVIAINDTFNGPANMYYIGEDHSLNLLEEMGEINMANYTTLRDFIDYCKTNYTAERYMLFFYGHGSAWSNAGRDETSEDKLTLDEVQKALNETGDVDITCFSGPCAMGSLEAAYELRNVTDVYVGSEEASSYFHWRPMLNDLCVLINKTPSISNIELGEEIIKMIKEKHYESFFDRETRNAHINQFIDLLFVTISAIDTSKLEDVADSFDKLARSLAARLPFNHFRINLIYLLTKYVYVTLLLPSWGRCLLDAYDFAKNCKNLFFFDKTIRNNAKEAMNNIEQAVIGNFRSLFYLRAHGLSIYFPYKGDNFDTNYTSLDLDFVHNTYWDEFLETYHGI